MPCQTASAEETCDHLLTHWISRYGFPMTFQSDNGKAFVGDLTKELMKRSHIAQAHSTTYHLQTNGLEERQNRTLVNMLRVYCSRYMTDWDKYLCRGVLNNTTEYGAGEFPLPTRPPVGSAGQSTNRPLSMIRSQQTEEAYPDLSSLKRELERAQRERDKAKSGPAKQMAGITDTTVWIGPWRSGREGTVSMTRLGPNISHSQEYQRVWST